jgi:hemerythrin-like domain-containing protein
MTYIIEVLRQEHCNIESLLRVLERELSVFDRGDRPDYEVVRAVIEYFKDYPDCCHHPKEDMIVEKLKARDPVAAATIGDLEAEHREGARRLRRVAQAVERVLSDRELLRQTVDDIIRDFIHHERQHMAMEERIVFPAALNALRPEDWAGIALKLTDRHDPFYQPGFEQKFNTLRRNILEMEEEAETERSD